MFGRKTFAKALTAWLRQDGSLAERLKGIEVELETEEDARLACLALDKALAEALREPDEADHLLHSVVAFFQSVKTREAFAAMAEQGLPRLRALVRQYVERRLDAPDVVMLALKQLALYGVIDDARVIAESARDEPLAAHWLWSVVFREASREPAFARELLEAFREPLPGGFCRVAYLDFATQGMREGWSARHPFDTAPGHIALRQWLSDPDPSVSSYAVSAAASLPFVADDVRGSLLEIADEHADILVRIEAAWARSKLGDEDGFVRLIAFARDPRTASRASAYLKELGAEDRIPAASSEPAFMALAEMAQWLAHPNEFGRMPDHIEIAAAHELFWPPTSDTRAPAERSVAAGRRLLAERNPEFRLRTV